MSRDSGPTRQARAGDPGDAHGLAALLVGILLAAGTALTQFGTGAPAFPRPAGPQPGARSGTGVRETTDQAGRMAALPTPRFLAPLDINAAGPEALQTLPGIGPTLAERIVADREARGPFRTPDELLRVPGIGPKRMERIRPLLRLTGTP